MYSTGDNQSSISVPVTTTQGGIGAIGGFNFGGNPNVSGLLQNKVALAIIGVVIVAAVIAWRKR